MAPKAHLRQRHGSDALRQEVYDADLDGNPYDGMDNGSGHVPDASAQAGVSRTRGLTFANGLASTAPAQSSHGRHRSRSSAYMSQSEAATVLLSKQITSLRTEPQYEHHATLAETTLISKSRSQPPLVPSWTNMPAKPQLAILAASRFVDFFQMAALQTYMVHQLKSFDPSQPDSVISHQAGVLQGAFTAAQIFTSILWGRLADRPTVGRKLVLMIGLVGTGISMLGVGFSSTYAEAVVWRVLGGAINGTVGAARTMVAETVPKQWHPRAFLLLPAAFNVANVAGPILGGLLVEPVRRMPGWVGAGSVFGGESGVNWMRNYPYAAANMLSTVLLFIEAAVVQRYLTETLKNYQETSLPELLDIRRLLRWTRESIRGLRSQGMEFFSESAMLKGGFLLGKKNDGYELDSIDNAHAKYNAAQNPRILPFHRIWTSNVLWTLLTIAIFDFHMGAFNNLWTLFLSTSRAYVPTEAGMTYTEDTEPLTPLHRRSPDRPHHSAFKFAGGLAFPPPTIGFAMAILGFIGVMLQFLLYPWANARFGLMRCFRYSLFFFPLAYFLAPYIALLPSSAPSPEPAAGFWVWFGIAAVLMLQVAARTFALPASILLLNNSTPHPSVLATIHGLGQADSATFRTLGPVLAGSWYGKWNERGVVGMAWWLVAFVSAIGCFASFYVRNGSGHEILLEGEEDDGAGGVRVVGGGAAGLQRPRRDSVRS